MATKLLILGKGDNMITMILDNLYSHNTRQPEIHIYNNMSLPIQNTFKHDRFNIEIFDTINMDDYDLMTLGVYQPIHKIKIVETLNPETNKFMNVIHDGLDISYTSKLGLGLLINSKVSIAAHTTIGNFVSINRNVSIGHHTNVGDYCSINPGVNIAGNVTIGKGTTIGIGANIIDGVKIGDNTIIGAGSLVTKDIPNNVVAYGNPCKIIKQNETQSI
jgi:sugar O-acyltransferase (sialic acid O-acetyltransferase NeuD family)